MLEQLFAILKYVDRIEAIISYKVERHFGKHGEYAVRTVEDTLSVMPRVLQKRLDLESVEEIEAEVLERMGTLEQIAPFTTKHHGDFSVARAV